MTFEGFDAAPLIEGAGFSPILAGGAAILIAGADGTLEAALQTAGPGRPRRRHFRARRRNELA